MTKKTKLILASLVVFVVAAAVGVAVWLWTAPEQKMILQWDFSKGFGELTQDAYVPGTEATTYAIDPTGGRDGGPGAVITNKLDNDARLVYTVEARANTYYRISAWIRTQGVDAGDGAIGANLSVMGLTDYGPQCLNGDQDWTHVEYYGKTAKGQKSFQVALRLGFYGSDIKGIAYFDDIEIEQLAELPKGAQAISFEKVSQSSGSSGNTNNGKLPYTYQDAMRVAELLLVGTIFLFFLGYRYATKRDREWEQSGRQLSHQGLSIRTAVWMILAAGLILRLVLSVTAPQCDIDVNLFQYWANQSASLGLSNTYPNAERLSLDYPPLYLYYLYTAGKIAKLFGLVNSPVFTMLIKLPAILSDCAIGYLVYRFADKRMNKTWTLWLVMLWVFNPVVLLDSAAWGQVDSILAFLLVGMLYFVMRERFVPASVMLALSVLLKPQGIILSPILFFALVKYLVRERKAKALLPALYSLGTFVAVLLVGMLPFWVKMPITWPFDLYLGTADGYQYATVNALNFWFMIGKNWIPDSQPFFGLTYFWWGMISIVVASMLTWILYQKSKRLSAMPFLLASVLLYSVVTFAPRMHERYFFPVVAFLMVALVYSGHKWLLWLYGLVSACGFLTVMEVMIDLLLGTHPGYSSPEGGMTAFCQNLSVANVATCVLLVVFGILAAFGKIRLEDPAKRLWALHDEVQELNLLEKADWSLSGQDR